jgi:hypothetical protein
MERAFLLMRTSIALAALPVKDTAKRFNLERSSAADLGMGGDIRHLRPGSTRLLRDEDLLRRPQQTYTVSDRSNLALKSEISGVPLEMLARVAVELEADTARAACFKTFDRVGSRVGSQE